MNVTVGVEAGGWMELGTLIDGRYRLSSIIGAGGMGVVWRATHETLGYDVALKQIPLEVQDGEPRDRIYERTTREAKNTGRLRDEEHVIGITDVLEDDDNVWLVLEYLDCLNLEELIEEAGPCSPAEVAWIGQRIARALAAGHALNIEHRDVKPGNVLIGRDGRTVRLGDYGISRREGDPTVTVIGAVPATLPYAAPEIVREQLTTPESDIWSLAATLYFAVEGRPPFGHHDNQQSLIEAVRAGRVEPMHRAGDALGPVLERMLMIDRDTRLDADTVEEKLGRIAEPLSGQTRETLRDHRPVRREALHVPATAPKKQISTQPEGYRESRGARLRRHFSRRNVVAGVAGVLVVGSLGAWGVFAQQQDSATTAEATIPGLPAAVGYVAVTGDERTVDPCRLIGLEPLQQYGQLTVSPEAFLNSCTVRVGVRGGPIYVDLYIYGRGDVSKPLERVLRRPVIDLGGISIQSYDLQEERGSIDPSDRCLNVVTLSDDREIWLESNPIGSVDRRDLVCEITDAMTVGVSRLVSGGPIPTDSNRLNATAFGTTSACALVDPALTLDSPSKSTIESFGGWSCRVGGGPGYDFIRYHQSLGRPIVARAGEIAGRPARLQLTSRGDYNENRCAVVVEVRRNARFAPTRNENLYILSEGPGSLKDQCARAEALAAVAITRLPPGN